ncbi:uncharacterized protein LOC129605875 [Condylostylus longicornis]|uniref:uncharacterized protein LOC129605875 n=1 Tax=Condylostylus longicornis TaxID=2530218 RepID=UPI00244E5881|nr:uncharacterized protein LOC129605875 [Condylostylus longicornis]
MKDAGCADEGHTRAGVTTARKAIRLSGGNVYRDFFASPHSAVKEDVEDKAIVFLDFKRAFEIVDRKILLDKFQKYGIVGNGSKWFESFLNCRKQKTCVGKELSESNFINNGVPQGTILVVLSFLLHINDIKLTNDLVRSCKIILFADDALIYIVQRGVDECCVKMNEDLNHLFSWLCMNKLKLNPDKTKYMVINDRSNSAINVEIGGTSIEKVDCMKYLGVLIDKHADDISNKIAKKVGYLGRIRNQITLKCAITIYNTTILRHLDYCSSLLFLCKEGKKDKLQVLQNKAMGIILKCNRRSNIRIRKFSVIGAPLEDKFCKAEVNYIRFIKYRT